MTVPGATTSVRTCSCPPATVAPWRRRDAPFSPASFVGGLVVLAFGVVALVAGKVPWVGWLLLGIVGVAAVVALVVLARGGHRGHCLLTRAAWYALATPGLPVRVVVGLGV